MLSWVLVKIQDYSLQNHLCTISFLIACVCIGSKLIKIRYRISEVTLNSVRQLIQPV